MGALPNSLHQEPPLPETSSVWADESPQPASARAAPLAQPQGAARPTSQRVSAARMGLARLSAEEAREQWSRVLAALPLVEVSQPEAPEEWPPEQRPVLLPREDVAEPPPALPLVSVAE